ncbi:MAG: 30S ribosomal protein S15 [Bacteroidetes bacterium]|nr:30S ribosomal protein S15 [Bacteroidota bacterium]
MKLSTQEKTAIFKDFGKSEFDSGTAECQIAMFTERIKRLTEHLKSMKNDLATERSLVRLVGKRRRLLDYLKEKDITRYRSIIKKLKIRK